MAEQRRQDQSQYRSHLDEVKHVHEKQKYIDRMTREQSEQQDLQERARVLQEYQTLKRMEDIDLRQYLQTQNMHMINEGVKVRQEKERKELVDDLERLKLLKLSSDEEQ